MTTIEREQMVKHLKEQFASMVERIIPPIGEAFERQQGRCELKVWYDEGDGWYNGSLTIHTSYHGSEDAAFAALQEMFDALPARLQRFDDENDK